jgi:transcriptional regulator with XRE-family HTH domain
MATRKSGPLDAMVGARISILRVSRGMSQATLAERIGVTFQQVQKYERGTTRVGASRLSQIASMLGVSVGELFESSGAGSPGLNSPVHLLAEPGALRVLKAYARTTSPRVRLCIAKLVESIASRTPGKATVALFNAVDRGERRKFPREDSLPQEDERQSRAAP